MTDLLDKLSNLSEETRAAALKNIDYNKEWRAGGNLQSINQFLYNRVQALEEQMNQLILPKTTVPMYYKLHLVATGIHTGDRNMTGEVEIDLRVRQITDYILIHSKTQVINELKVTTKDRLNEIPVLEYELYPAADTLIIYFFEELPAAAEIAVHIKYSTVMPTFGSGFYQTTYSLNGQTRYVGSTQFQPTGARYTFPHYDEPEYKAIFELKITHHASYSAIANTFGTDELK